MQNWAAFRLGHGGAVRGMIPAQAPYEGGGAHDAQGLLLRRVGLDVNR